MNELIRHIEYLLRDHDCVVVPGFGAFIIQHHSAHYDTKSRIFYPPSATVIFNPELTHNDGLLATSVARRDGIPYDRASRVVTDEITGMKSQLMTDGELQAGHLGRFSLVEGKIIFTPETDSAVAPELSTLKSLNISRIADRESVSTDSYRNVETRILTPKHWVRIAASIAVIFVMGILFSTPLLLDRTDINFAGLALTRDTYIDNEVADEPEEVEITLNIAYPGEEADGFAVADTVKLPYTQSDDDPYYLVVASLANRQQAEIFVNQKQGKWPLKIIERAGKTRVIAATGNSANEVMTPTADSDFARTFPDAWPCHR